MPPDEALEPQTKAPAWKVARNSEVFDELEAVFGRKSQDLLPQAIKKGHPIPRLQQERSLLQPPFAEKPG